MTSAAKLQTAEKNRVEQTANFYRIIGLVVDVGSKILRDVIYTNYPREKLAKILRSGKDKIDKLKGGVINPDQYVLLTKASPDPEEFDITLLVVVLRNFCTREVEAPDHKKKWFAKVEDLKPDDTNLGAEILRLKDARNKITAHSISTRMPTDKFNDNWENICGIIKRIATKIKKTEDEMRNLNNEMREIFEMTIHVTGDKERKWLETFRKGQLEEFEEIKQDIVEFLCDSNKQLRKLIGPWMGKLCIKIDKLIIPSPDAERPDVSDELSAALQDVDKVLEQDKKKILYYGYDAYIFYAEADGKACQDDIKILKERSTVPELKIALYKDLPLEELPIERRMAYILENCRLLLFYVTSSFTADTLKIFQKDMCLSHVIEERSYRAFPLWKKPKDGKEEVPLDLKAIEGLDLWKLTGTVDEQQSFIEKFDRRFREERKRKP